MTVMRSKRRWINWEKEGRILREDMPIGFRAQIETFPKLPRNKSRTAPHYKHALQALAALTFSSSVGVASAALRGTRVDSADSVTDPLWSLLSAQAQRKVGPNFVELCLECLPQVLDDDHAYRFINVLSDVHGAGSRQGHNSELLNDLAQISEGMPWHELNAKFHELVASLFGYWPKYALGYRLPGQPVVRFDTDELGDLLLTADQLGLLEFNVSKLGEPLCNLILGTSPRLDQTVMPVFIADIAKKDVWMISPFVLCRQLSKTEDDLASHEYLFVDPLWFSNDRELSFYRFARPEEIKRRAGGRKMVLNDVLLRDISFEIGPHYKAIRKSILHYPFQLQLGEEQDRQTFHYLEHELTKVDFVTDIGEVFRVDPGVDRPGLFYRTGASAYVQVHQIDPLTGRRDMSQTGAGKVFIAKVLEPQKRGVYEFEEQRFEPERSFVERCSREIGSGIVKYHAAGVAQAKAGYGAASNVQYAGQPFYLREYRPNNLSDTIEKQEREIKALSEAKLPANELELRLARLILRSLYTIERCAATLASIYDRTREDVSRDGIGSQARKSTVHFLHRDIRPQVLLKYTGGIVKVCDFSAAFFPPSLLPNRLEIPEFLDDQSQQSQDLVILDSYGLSAYYCAPEVYERPNVFSPTADVFSLGRILDELLFGKRDNVQRTLLKWVRDNPSRRNWGDLLYTPPQGRISEVFASLSAKIEAFSAATSMEGPAFGAFDLRRLVGRATCHHGTGGPEEIRRFTMHEFRDAVADKGYLLQSYIADVLKRQIDTSLQASETAALLDSLKAASSIFARVPGDRSTRAMVRCIDCVRGRQATSRGAAQPAQYYDIDALYFCERPDEKSKLQTAADALAAVGARIARRSVERDHEQQGFRSGLELTKEDAERALHSVRTALDVCPGIIDRVPDEVADFVPLEKLNPHRRFHDAGRAVFETAALEPLRLPLSPASEKPAASDSARQLARDVLNLTLEAALARHRRQE